jgi:hypothetical protein
MAKAITKVLSGPMTSNAEGPPAVRFVGPEGNVFGELNLIALPGMTEKLLVQVVKACPMFVRLALHGASQKGGDSYAGAAEAENPMAWARDAIKATIDQILAGDWRVVGVGGPRVTLLARALARVTGRTPEQAQSVIDVKAERDDDGKPSEAGAAWLKAIRGRSDIKKATADIKAEDAAKAKEAAGKLAEAEGSIETLLS